MRHKTKWPLKTSNKLCFCGSICMQFFLNCSVKLWKSRPDVFSYFSYPYLGWATHFLNVFIHYYPWSPSQRPVGLPWLAKTSSVRFLVRSSKSWWLCLYKEIFNLYSWLQLPARRSYQRCVRFILFRNKNTQTFCYKSLLPWFLYHLKSTCIGLFHCKQIFRYCNDMNAKAIDF